MKTAFYVYVTQTGAVRVTRRAGDQSKKEVKIRLVVDIPNEAWEPAGIPNATITVPLESLVRPPIELEVEALPDPPAPPVGDEVCWSKSVEDDVAALLDKVADRDLRNGLPE